MTLTDGVKTVDDINFKGKKVLVRVDYNVPLDKDRCISDDTRVVKSKETIEKILQDGGRVILLSHLGRPNGPDDDLSFKTIYGKISEVLGYPVTFIQGTIGKEVANAINQLQDGQIGLLENVRFHKEEEDNELNFSKALIQSIDLYVNEAFGCSHRAHASVYGVPKLLNKDQKYAGRLLDKEVKSLEKVFNTQGSKTAIVGGSKISTKIDILMQLLDQVNNLVIGGAMVYTFIKAKGGEIGKSLVEDSMLDTARKIISLAKEKNVSLYLPEDTITAEACTEAVATAVAPSDQIPMDQMGLDIGPNAIEAIHNILMASDAILWNGPMGVFEIPIFAKGTFCVADSIAKAKEKGTFSVVGGGDTVAATNQFKLQDKISYICTGGGAMLELLGGKKLPGIVALED